MRASNKLPDTVTVTRDGLGPTYNIKGSTASAGTVEVWEDLGYVWIRQERGEVVDLLCMDLATAQDFHGAMHKVLYE